MKKIITFSLWGNTYRYLGGAMQNVELAKIIYPDWICRFYIGKSTNKDFIDDLRKYDNVEVIEMGKDGDWTSMTWRFLACSDEDIDIMICRDADSRLTHREKLSVDEWVNSDKGFHIIRDSPYHNTLILGGMWGSKKGVINNMKDMINADNPGNFWQSDQTFLREKIYPLIKDNVMVHDEFLKYEPFCLKNKIERNPLHFIGQAYDGDGKILDRPEFFQDYVKDIKLTTYKRNV